MCVRERERERWFKENGFTERMRKERERREEGKRKGNLVLKLGHMLWWGQNLPPTNEVNDMYLNWNKLKFGTHFKIF